MMKAVWLRFVRFAMLMLVAGTGAIADVTTFREEAVARGLIYQMIDYPQSYGVYGFGCGFADLDGDGDEDVILLGRADRRAGIFENDGTGHFTDRTETSGIPALPQASGFAAADLDGDGDVDIYFTQMGQPNVLVVNEGGFTFSDITEAAGVGDAGASKSASLGDYDGDGHLDIYVVNYNGAVPNTANLNNVLYRNRGDGTFEDVSIGQGVDDRGYGFQSVWFDYDLDGDVDLYLSNDRAPLNGLRNRLWRNDDGVLVDVSAASGADVGIFSMGVACGDFDRNGWPDLYCTNLPSGDGYNPLLLNRSDGTFLESAHAFGVENAILSWGSIFFDCDNNGWLDLYVNNMWAPNTMYLNIGAPCAEIGAVAGVQSNAGPSFASAVADVDNDGDMDLLVNNLQSNVELFINQGGGDLNHARVRPRGIAPNTSAVGARISLRTESVWQMAEILAGGNGYTGQNELAGHFGLNHASVIDELIVTWPGGSPVRRYTNLPANRTFTPDPSLTADLDADGTVGVTDLLRVLAEWGPCADCTEDINGNGAVEITDLLAMLASWGG